jgi:hypothetical protein
MIFFSLRFIPHAVIISYPMCPIRLDYVIFKQVFFCAFGSSATFCRSFWEAVVSWQFVFVLPEVDLDTTHLKIVQAWSFSHNLTHDLMFGSLFLVLLIVLPGGDPFTSLNDGLPHATLLLIGCKSDESTSFSNSTNKKREWRNGMVSKSKIPE